MLAPVDVGENHTVGHTGIYTRGKYVRHLAVKVALAEPRTPCL